MVYKILSFLAMTMSVTGNIFVNRKSVIGMYIWTVGSLLWLGLACYRQDLAQVIMFIIYTILNIEGIIKWRNTNELKFK